MATIGLSRRLVSLSTIVILIDVALGQTSYHASIEAWRAEREATITGEEGWLSVTGLFWLKEGANRFGTGADNEIVLPLESGDEVRAEPATEQERSESCPTKKELYTIPRKIRSGPICFRLRAVS